MRCAIYTRKSTEEGLEQEFSSLDHQRESGEAYCKSQGWTAIDTRYDDGGFSGGNTDRPAIRRLMADVEAGKIDCVVVYKVDRLSRSLLDFGRLMEVFDAHNVAFVAVTQRIDTSTSMGRLMLNVLLSFAQFEREIIAERTRDKIAASRRKGKYTGGRPVLGYSVVDTKLVVDEAEAKQVREIFELYLEHRSLIAVATELNLRSWLTKSWTTRKGTLSPGLPFNKTNLHKLLTNPLYVGKVKYKTELHKGEHQPLITEELWSAVQKQLSLNGTTGGAKVRNKFGALLKGLLHCSACKCALSPSHSTKGNRRYRYYVCTNAQKTSWSNCPSKSIPALEIEKFALDQIRSVGRNPAILAATIQESNKQGLEQREALDGELAALRRDVKGWTKELPTATASVQADLHERLAAAERRATEVHEARSAIVVIDPAEVTAALADFDALWAALTPVEQTRVVELLVNRIDYDGRTGRIVVSFNPTGILQLKDAA